MHLPDLLQSRDTEMQELELWGETDPTQTLNQNRTMTCGPWAPSIRRNPTVMVSGWMYEREADGLTSVCHVPGHIGAALGTNHVTKAVKQFDGGNGNVSGGGGSRSNEEMELIHQHPWGAYIDDNGPIGHGCQGDGVRQPRRGGEDSSLVVGS